MAKIGQLNNGGCRRLAFSEEDFIAKKLLINWCTEIGLNVSMDPIGNLFAELKGKFKKKVINDKLYDKKGFEFRLQNYLAKLKPDLICLAGFMKILSSLIIKKWKNKIINVHPSLLPSFKGLKTHERVISEGVKKSGCTIHFVNETLDGGPIIAQGSTMVKKNMTVKELQKKILKIEHIIYPEVIKLFAKKKITIKNNKVFIKTNKTINKSFD